MLVFLGVGKPAGVIDFRVAGIEANRRVEVLDRFVEVTSESIDTPPNEVRLRIIGPQANSLTETLNRHIEILVGSVCLPPAVVDRSSTYVGVSTTWIEVDGPGAVLNGLFEQGFTFASTQAGGTIVVHGRVGGSPLHVCVDVGWVTSNVLAQRLNCRFDKGLTTGGIRLNQENIIMQGSGKVSRRLGSRPRSRRCGSGCRRYRLGCGRWRWIVATGGHYKCNGKPG